MQSESLSPEERALLERLRAVPAGAMRDSLMPLMLDLLTFAREPSCAAAQADGVPCDSAHSTCERCRDAVAVLDELDAALAGVLGAGRRERAPRRAREGRMQ